VLRDPHITRHAETLKKWLNVAIPDEHPGAVEDARVPELALSLTGC
jgi:hypothetical protein